MQNGVIVHSDLLLEYLKKHYSHLYFVSSITKVITDFKQLVEEIRREDFRYVVQICMNMPEDSTDYYYLANKKRYLVIVGGKDVSVMCNLSQGIVDDAKAEIILNMFKKAIH